MARMIAVGVCAAMLLAACTDEDTRRADPATYAEPAPAAPARPAADATAPTDAEAPTDSTAPTDAADAPDAPEPAGGAEAAAAVLGDYFARIAAGQHAAARALWAPGTPGETIAQLGEGNVDAGGISATLGAPGRIEGAAGSRFVSIPVSLEVVSRDGRVLRFEGRYALRRSVVDGATAEQRQWRIHSADMREVP